MSEYNKTLTESAEQHDHDNNTIHVHKYLKHNDQEM